MIPHFILFKYLGWIDTFKPLIIPSYLGGGAFNIFLLRQFFKTIPIDLEDAARIDGCSAFGFFWRVVLPLSRPAIATVAVLAIVGSWNAFLLPLVVFSSADQWTLPLGVMNFSTQYTSDTARVLAFTTLSMIPALIFYVIAERQIVGGLTAGAVKG